MQPCSSEARPFSQAPAFPPACRLPSRSFRASSSFHTGISRSFQGLHYLNPSFSPVLLIRPSYATKPPPESDDVADEEEKPVPSRDEGGDEEPVTGASDEVHLRSETLQKDIDAAADRGRLWEIFFKGGFGRKKAPVQPKATTVGEGAWDIEWRDLVDPTPENLLALLLTGLLGLAVLQILWQLLLVSITITLAAVKYSVIAAILVALLIVFL